MRNKRASFLCMCLAFAALLAGSVCGTLWVLNNYVIVNMHFYPSTQEVLDLREKEDLSLEEIEAISEQLPDTKILWAVPFQGKRISSETQELVVEKLSEEDVDALACLPELRAVHAEECTDYPQLRMLAKALPKAKVFYQVWLGDMVYDQDAAAVTVPDLDEEQAELLQYLPDLSSVDATGSENMELIFRLQKEHPEWNVRYQVTMGGREIPSDAADLTVENSVFEEARYALTALPNLQTLSLNNPDMTLDQLHQLQADFPNVKLSWKMEFGGQSIDSEAEEVDISYAPISSIEEAEKIAAFVPNLKKLIVDSGNISNDDMAAYRERVRDQYKVVWTVYMSDKCKSRTDATYFMPIKQGEYYFQEKHVYNLRYCEDLIAIDVGHAPIKSIDFVQFMPHLKYLILAHTELQDITPISCLKELVYLELDWSLVKDYTPLQGCTALEDLNIGKTYAPIEPLFEMKWLKNVWCVERGSGVAYQLKEALPDTHVNYGGNATVANGWRELPNYFAMRDALEMEYMPW